MVLGNIAVVVVGSLVMGEPPAPAAATTTTATRVESVVKAARAQVGVTKGYDPAYVNISYPGGDVPLETGVCTDVVVRAFRAAGIDLQKVVHEDMSRNFAKYPKDWGLKRADSNIDHRRVPNLMRYFERAGVSLGVSKDAKQFLPGDVVAWKLSNGRLHIGVVVDGVGAGGAPLVAHNIGSGAVVEDVLFEFEMLGHYRPLK